MKKKMLFVANTLGRAGAERSLIALLDVIDQTRYDLYFLAMIPRGEFFASIPPGVKILNPSYSCQSVMDRQGIMSCAFAAMKAVVMKFAVVRYIPYAVKNIICQIKQGRISPEKIVWYALSSDAPVFDEEFDLAVAYLEGAATYYVAEKVKAKKKVAFLHVDYRAAGYVRDIDRPYYACYEKIYCVSNSVKKGFSDVFPEYAPKMEFFQNTVSDAYILDCAQNGIGFTDHFDGIRLLTIGRLHYQKAYDIAIRAFAKLLSQSDLKIRWYVIGEGLLEKELKKQIKRYHLEGKFILLGAHSNPYPFLKQCDIYVHATRFEGWSIAIAEAKSLKKPIIASNTAGVSEQLSEDSSIIINLSEDEIVSAISLLANDASLRAKLTNALSEKWHRSDDKYKLYDLCEEVG